MEAQMCHGGNESDRELNRSSGLNFQFENKFKNV